MSYVVRDGKFDVAVLAGPGVELWPSAGVRALSKLCGEVGLNVGVFGGESLNVRGVIPLGGTGGLAIVQDVQNRLHRIQARAIVKVSVDAAMPDLFEGSRSPGLIPLLTAKKLLDRRLVQWGPATVILGTGNRALRFGSGLLESGVPEVYCVESHLQWGAKRFAGWEVERRRFEMSGGKILEAKPVSLRPKSAQLWEFRLADAQGVRVLEVARVVSAGPFRDVPGVREYPPSSFLFELMQTAEAARNDDIEGWVFEEERGRWLAAKIIRALVADPGEHREKLERIHSRARNRLKRYLGHREDPFAPVYHGKWIASADMRRLRDFSGIPREARLQRKVASIECFEQIPCTACQDACPEQAIQFSRVFRRSAESVDSVLTESRCTACGICVSACPSGAAYLLHEREDRSTSEIVLPWRGKKQWRVGEFATLLNRRGESLGNGRITGIPAPQELQVELPTHLIWEARAVRPLRGSSATDESFIENFVQSSSAPATAVAFSSVATVVSGSGASPGAGSAAGAASAGGAGIAPLVQKVEKERVEITFNGEKRLVERELNLSIALFETGHSRAADILSCRDGSCGLCAVVVDGIKQLACRTEVRKGMTVKLPETSGVPRSAQVLGSGATSSASPGDQVLCPCLGITGGEVIERLSQGKLQSVEAVLSSLHLGEGKCHGRLCMEPFRRVLADQGLDASQWIDWRFPWSDWTLTRS